MNPYVYPTYHVWFPFGYSKAREVVVRAREHPMVIRTGKYGAHTMLIEPTSMGVLRAPHDPLRAQNQRKP